jgi:hypothetical protein
MNVRWRLPGAAVLALALGATDVAAQTVVVRHLDAGANVEGSVNGSTAVSGKADAVGNAKLVLNALTGTNEIGARISVDACGADRVVIVTDRDAPAVSRGCTRTQISGVFVVRRTTTLVIDTTASQPALLITQGQVPADWLRDVLPEEAIQNRRVSRGLTLFGGAGMTHDSDVVTRDCGTSTTSCQSDGLRPGSAFGFIYQVSPILGAVGSYSKYGIVNTTGTTDTSSFTSTLDADVIQVGVIAGVPYRSINVFAEGGLNRHQGTQTLFQRIDESQVTDENGNVVNIGGRTTRSYRTQGLGWYFGGGLDVWVLPRLAVYGDAQMLRLKGTQVDGGEAVLDDHVISFQVGVRFRLGRPVAGVRASRGY